MVDKIQIAILINEKQATVDFPYENGEIDFNKLFYSDDPIFHEWCLDYFQYIWDKSYFFNKEKLNVSNN